MERLVAVWVRELSREDTDGTAARQYVQLLDELAVLCPFVDAVRVGLVVFPLRGPSRFFGGEQVVLDHVSDTTQRVLGLTPLLGVGEGLFTAFCAARLSVCVKPGLSDGFRRSLPIAALERKELATVCRRLGLHTVGAFSDLAPARVAERFSRDALHAHRVARGEDSELRGQRDEGLTKRVRDLRGESHPTEFQSGFFGDHLDADRRAAIAATRVRQRLGPSGVLIASVHGGRTPQDRATLYPWGAPSEIASSHTEPWPGRLPAPSPVTTFSQALALRVLDEHGAAVSVDHHGLLSAPPTRVVSEREFTRDVQWFAGPWPTLERWWSTRRRRAYVQILTAHEALLIYAERGSWWLAGIYD